VTPAEYRVLALLVLAAVIWYALSAYHRRQLAHLEERGLALEGWVKLRLRAVPYAWQCPQCGGVMLTKEGRTAHEASSQSACAAFTDRVRWEERRAGHGQAPAAEVPWTAITEPEEEG
jgi:hypothetical protein